MALDPDDATPHDGHTSAEDAAAAQAAALLAQVRTVVDDPLRRGSTEILIGLIQNLIVAAARGLDANIGVLYCRFGADRIAETHAGYRRGDPRQVYTLLKMASEALLLQDIQEQREDG